jgi:hypothetical protein
MTKYSLALLAFLLLATPIFAQETEPASTVNLRQEALKLADMTRTSHRLHIGVTRLVQLREALQQATDLILRQESMESTYANIARYWVSVDRKKAREALSKLISAAGSLAQNAADLNGYRRSSDIGMLFVNYLSQIDPEGARKIVELWPEPPASLGEEGRKAMEQLQKRAANEILSGKAQISSQDYQSYIDPQLSASQPFQARIDVATSLASSNQKDQARQILDQGIRDLANVTPDPNQLNDYRMFFEGLWHLYPERFLDTLEAFRVRCPQTDSSNDRIYEIGDKKVQLTPVEAMTVGILKGVQPRPELAARTISANSGLKAKLDQLGGLDRVLSSFLSVSGPSLREYSAALPVSPASGNIVTTNILPISTAQDNAASPVTAEDLLKQLMGRAETNPEWVRRKLADACTHKEHFQVLIKLAQGAVSVDPDLGTIALEVAGGLLRAFDTLSSRASALRNLVNISRNIDGAVDSSLWSEGLNLVADLREEEKQQEQANEMPASGALQPSDNLEIYLIGQIALNDYSTAMQRVRSLRDDNLRIRALTSIVQYLTSY